MGNERHEKRKGSASKILGREKEKEEKRKRKRKGKGREKGKRLEEEKEIISTPPAPQVFKAGFAWSLTEIGRIEVMVVCDPGMLPKSHSRLGRKRLGLPRQVPRHWQASLRQDLYLVVTGSVLGFPSANLLVVSQLECSRVVLWCCKYFSTAV